TAPRDRTRARRRAVLSLSPAVIAWTCSPTMRRRRSTSRYRTRRSPATGSTAPDRIPRTRVSQLERGTRECGSRGIIRRDGRCGALRDRQHRRSGRGRDREPGQLAVPARERGLLMIGGAELADACRDLATGVGSVRVTEPGRLRTRHVIHAVSPAWRGGDAGERDELRRVHELVVETAARLGCRTL